MQRWKQPQPRITRHKVHRLLGVARYAYRGLLNRSTIRRESKGLPTRPTQTSLKNYNDSVLEQVPVIISPGPENGWCRKSPVSRSSSNETLDLHLALNEYRLNKYLYKMTKSRLMEKATTEVHHKVWKTTMKIFVMKRWTTIDFCQNMDFQTTTTFLLMIEKAMTKFCQNLC